MAGDGRDAHRVHSPLEQTGGGFVPEIVEAEIHQKARIRLPFRRKTLLLAGRPGSPCRPTEGLSHGIRGHGPDPLPLPSFRERLTDPDSLPREGNPPPLS